MQLVEIGKAQNGFIVRPVAPERHSDTKLSATHVFESYEGLFRHLEEIFSPLVEIKPKDGH